MSEITRRLRAFMVSTIALGGLLVPGAGVAGAPTVILLSWDGVRHDYPERTSLPALARMQKEGLRAGRLTPVFPASTFPNHVALATGARTDRHGIVANTFRDRERGMYSYEADASWIEAEPIWIAAERQGLRAATFFWVGSETDWNGRGASYRRTPFSSEIGEAEKVDQILAWLDLPEPERPSLIMAWWHGADSPGHNRGPDHASIAEALEQQDAQLARLLSGLDERSAWPDTTVIVVSDHGMTEVTEIVEVHGPLEEADIAADVVLGSSTAHIFLEDPATLERAEQILRSIQNIEVYRRDAIPEALHLRHPTRNGDLVLITGPPRVFYRPTSASRLLIGIGGMLGMKRGGHGYDPAHPDMGAIFFALGRGVDAGARPTEVRAIDVAPTVARLLGIEPPLHAEGKPIAGIGPAPAP